MDVAPPVPSGRPAADTGTPVVARSGGHSYGGFSTTRGITIDVSSIGAVGYDAATGHATVGGGVRNSGLYRALGDVDRTVTHGRCYGVGVSGLVLGGGVGFNMRRFGLTCDQLLGTTLVLADGEVVRADAEQNPDLFWAARGAGGGNFGIHTEFTFQTQPAGEIVVFDHTYTAGLEELLSAVLDAAFDAPRQLAGRPRRSLRAGRASWLEAPSTTSPPTRPPSCTEPTGCSAPSTSTGPGPTARHGSRRAWRGWTGSTRRWSPTPLTAPIRPSSIRPKPTGPPRSRVPR